MTVHSNNGGAPALAFGSFFLKSTEDPLHSLKKSPFFTSLTLTDVILKNTHMYKHRNGWENAIPFIGLSSFFLCRRIKT